MIEELPRSRPSRAFTWRTLKLPAPKWYGNWRYKKEYFAAYSGMKGQSIVTDPKKILDATKKKSNQDSRMWNSGATCQDGV